METQSYIDDVRRVFNEIMAFVNVRGKVIVDFGVGESTKFLIAYGAKVIGIDKDSEKIVKYSYLNIPFIICDILRLPFRGKIADISFFSFILHEINPKYHVSLVKMTKDISSKIVIVEPSPRGCITYNKYAILWRNAMRSIGLFEEYKSLKYWIRVVGKAGFRTVKAKVVKWRTKIPKEVLEEIFARDSEVWRKLGVRERYINELLQLLKYAKEKGMKWSNVYVVIGEH